MGDDWGEGISPFSIPHPKLNQVERMRTPYKNSLNCFIPSHVIIGDSLEKLLIKMKIFLRGFMTQVRKAIILLLCLASSGTVFGSDKANGKGLDSILKTYQKIANHSGGWPQIPNGPSLRKGDEDDRIPLVRKRLALTGDLKKANKEKRFDDSL